MLDKLEMLGYTKKVSRRLETVGREALCPTATRKGKYRAWDDSADQDEVANKSSAYTSVSKGKPILLELITSPLRL
jgi:hypothetical protein